MQLMNIDGFPYTELLNKVLNLHESIFKDSDTLISKTENKPKVVFIAGLVASMGNHRNKGIASKLNAQFNSAVTPGYIA